MVILGSSLVLFVMWIVMANVNQYRKEKYPGIINFLATLYLIAFVVFDVIFNSTIGIIVFNLFFWKKGIFFGKTLTARLKYILVTDEVESKRWEVSHWICRKLISPWDYDHCGMELGGQYG